MTTLFIQTLDGEHKASIVGLKWSQAQSKKHVAHETMLASADGSGRIFIWNVKSGEVKARLQEGSKPVTAMEWLDGSIDATGHLLVALHPPNNLILWDTYNGKQVQLERTTGQNTGLNYRQKEDLII
jgi:WD40 repeat protein